MLPPHRPALRPARAAPRAARRTPATKPAKQAPKSTKPSLRVLGHAKTTRSLAGKLRVISC
jgi:hypothetical protein